MPAMNVREPVFHVALALQPDDPEVIRALGPAIEEVEGCGHDPGPLSANPVYRVDERRIWVVAAEGVGRI